MTTKAPLQLREEPLPQYLSYNDCPFSSTSAVLSQPRQHGPNVSYHVLQKGLSPLMPGQWKVFLAFYAGLLLD